ncbi:uncharacterized protein LOC132717038 [Ruditapes philippinarum]|uniref:uncharacterized protein LOC132717038 n=1 Tax=Ruditapes philippinarum TaxID=129788 RepID=UPI00295BCB78|nr:uncharacterized protein LOC132717038 [Ruditapes philippinarum]
MMMKTILTVVICLTLCHTVLCIDCHQCASKDDGSIPPFCTDPYDGDEMADNIDGCDDKDTHCLKSKAVSYLNDAGFILGAPRESVAVTRGCIRADGEGDYCKYIEADAGFFFWCICSEDGCNGAGDVISSMTLTLVLAISSIVIRRLL